MARNGREHEKGSGAPWRKTSRHARNHGCAMHLGLVRNGFNPRLIGHRINCLVTSPDAEIAAAPTIYEHQLRPRTSCHVNLLICPKRDRPLPAPMIGASMPPEHSLVGRK